MSRSPVNPAATLEARALLNYLYENYGRKTLSGQHNQMHKMSAASDRVQAITNRFPMIWGGEWGFSDGRHDVDNIKYRPALLDEIRKQHARGCIIVMTYHQANPLIGEPCDFDPGVIGELNQAQWDELLTEGTALRSVWQSHVDRLAFAFKTLALENIPIIFRPYHEMNGNWFWWGGDSERFKKLWNLIYNRFTNLHGLNNLLWAWNPDKPWPGVEDFFPGHESVDLIGTDIYPTNDRAEIFPTEWFDSLKVIAAGKPLALSENSALPTSEDLVDQRWSYVMGWDNLTFKANSDEAIRSFFENPDVVSINI